MTTKGFNQFSKEVNEFVKSIGFDNNDIPLRIALIHSEISEAFEAFRKDKFCINVNDPDFQSKVKDTFEDEIADSIIRLFDLCGHLEIDIESHIERKMHYNATRGYRYGGKKF